MNDSGNNSVNDALDTTSKPNLIPYILVGVVAIVVLLGAIFWPTDSDNANKRSEPVPVKVEEPVEPEPVQIEPESEPEPEVEDEPFEAPVVPAEFEPEPEAVPEPEPLDTSDIAVKAAVLAVANNPDIAPLIINDDLLRRFVVFTNNLADEELATNFHILNAPDKGFRTYQQAGKEWIDAASFKRYTPYAQAIDGMSVGHLLNLYQLYKPAILGHFAEIGYPNSDFDETLLSAIDHLLATPEIPLPVEVFTESVVYKYADSRVESLSGAQKQLLRTGPENMRLIKAKLREVKQALTQ